MSTYVLMKLLEAWPSRYDKGMRIITLGKIDPVYDNLARFVKKGWRVLDVGCGPGALSLRAGAQGARVLGIDTSPKALEVARRRARDAGLSDGVRFSEMGVAEMGEMASGSFDAVLCGLVLSELREEELGYALAQIHRVLRAGGLLLVADEVLPGGFLARAVRLALRAPLAIMAYALTRTTTRALRDLPGRLTGAGFVIKHMKTRGSLMELVAEKP